MSESTTQDTQTATAQGVPAVEVPALQQIDELLGLAPKKTEPEKAPETAPGREPAAEGKQDTEESQETEQTEGGKAFDYAQEVPLSDGEKKTVGELKDFYQGYARTALELTERENRVMAQYAELQEMGQYLQLPPEAKQRIAQQQHAYLREQHGLMLQAIPEWKDNAVFEQARGQIFDLGKEYGVDLSQVSDHRTVKMLNDFAKLRAAIRGAKANVKPVRTTEPKAPAQAPQGRATDLQQAQATAKRTGNIADQMKAVDLLLNG